MTPEEREWLRAEMRSADRYLEYGSGASTQMAVECENIKTIYSIESDAKFVENTLAKDPAISAAQANARLHFQFINIGATRKWGFPQNRSKLHLWANYALAPYRQEIEWNLILIDGRFRVACVLLAALEAPSDCTIFVHDFSDRSHYKAMLRFMCIARQVDTLVQLKRRDDFDAKQAQRALRAYLYTPDDRVGLTKLRYLFNVLWLRATGRDSGALT
jgi:hypothetical protein